MFSYFYFCLRNMKLTKVSSSVTPPRYEIFFHQLQYILIKQKIKMKPHLWNLCVNNYVAESMIWDINIANKYSIPKCAMLNCSSIK